MPITNPAEEAVARAELKHVQGQIKSLEAERREITQPLKSKVAEVEKTFRERLGPLEKRKTELKVDLEDWLVRVTKQKHEAEAMVAEVQRKLAEGEVTYADAAEEFMAIPDVAAPTVSFRRVKTLVIDDPALIPRQYLVPDEAAIKAALEAGESVPGCRIVVEQKPVAR